MSTLNIYETTDVDLGSFLLMSNLKLLETQIKDEKKRIVVLRFLDPDQVCLDLERVYISSEFKKFRELNKYLLKQVHKTIREAS